MKAIWKVRVNGKTRFFRVSPTLNRVEVLSMARTRFVGAVAVISRDRFERI